MQYAVGEAVRLWVNKVGPYNNPQETYNYYHLPFCKPNQAVKPAHKWGGLGEVLQGNELIDSQLDLSFQSAARSDHTLCSMAEREWHAAGWMHACRARGLRACRRGCAAAAAEVPKQAICSSRLTEASAAAFRKAVLKHYWCAPCRPVPRRACLLTGVSQAGWCEVCDVP